MFNFIKKFFSKKESVQISSSIPFVMPNLFEMTSWQLSGLLNGAARFLQKTVSLDEYITEQLTFDDKAEYLLWRSQWKEKFKDVSLLIRTLRYQIGRQDISEENRSLYQSRKIQYRKIATIMLLIKHASKLKAHQQHLMNSKDIEKPVNDG
jgi:hypothetical protein